MRPAHHKTTPREELLIESDAKVFCNALMELNLMEKVPVVPDYDSRTSRKISEVRGDVTRIGQPHPRRWNAGVTQITAVEDSARRVFVFADGEVATEHFECFELDAFNDVPSAQLVSLVLDTLGPFAFETTLHECPARVRGALDLRSTRGR